MLTREDLKKRKTAHPYRHPSRNKVFFIRLESPDNGITPGDDLLDKDGAVRRFEHEEARAWVLAYKKGGTKKECDKAGKEAIAKSKAELEKLNRRHPEALKREKARIDAELGIIEERAGKDK